MTYRDIQGQCRSKVMVPNERIYRILPNTRAGANTKKSRGALVFRSNYMLYKPVSDWLEMLALDSTGLNM